MSKRKTFTHDAKANVAVGASALTDDAKTYAERQCPLCARSVKVRTYPRATDRAGLEKFPKHNDNNGHECQASRLTMRQAAEAFGTNTRALNA